MELCTKMQVFHNGIPVELLYQITANEWMVQPLFVKAEPRPETFKPEDRYSFLHTTKVRTKGR